MATVPIDHLFDNSNTPPVGRAACTIGYGKVNYANVLATYAALKVTPEFQRTSAVTSGVRVGSQTTTRAGTWDGNGVLISVNVMHDIGSVFVLQVKHMRGPFILRDGALFLRLRVGAPLYNIIASVPSSPENICGDSFQMFSGNADICNPEELKLLGIDVPRGFITRFMDREELAECFRIVQVAPATVEKPSISAIATPTGIKMREIAQPPKRRMIVRRKE